MFLRHSSVLTPRPSPIDSPHMLELIAKEFRTHPNVDLNFLQILRAKPICVLSNIFFVFSLANDPIVGNIVNSIVFDAF